MKEFIGIKGLCLIGNIILLGCYLVLMFYGWGVNLFWWICFESEWNCFRVLVILIKLVGMGLLVCIEVEGMVEEVILEDLEVL